MAEYKEIKGFNVQTISSDPSTINEGDIWYNSTSGKLKAGIVAGTWATAPNYPVALSAQGQGAGTATAALGFGGSSASTVSAEYDGSSWTANPGLNSGRSSAAGFGIQTSAVAVGGDLYPSPTRWTNNTEYYAGSSWTAGTVTPTAIAGGSGFGTYAAGVVAGGSGALTTTGTLTIPSITDSAASTGTSGS